MFIRIIININIYTFSGDEVVIIPIVQVFSCISCNKSFVSFGDTPTKITQSFSLRRGSTLALKYSQSRLNKGPCAGSILRCC